MRCTIYARYSSNLQRGTSIEDELVVAHRYAEQQGRTPESRVAHAAHQH